MLTEEAFDELMQILKIESKNSIKSFLLDECMSFMENGYILSDNMMQEFNSLKYKVDIIRKEYLELCHIIKNLQRPLKNIKYYNFQRTKYYS